MRLAYDHGSFQRPNSYRPGYGNGEYFVSGTGITYSTPSIAAYFQRTHPSPGITEPELWLERETSAVLALANAGQSTLVEGDLGSGKSTVLYGARTLMRKAGVSYVAVNGHYLDHGPAIANAIHTASREGHTLFYDSLDYLFVRNSVKKDAKSARPVVMEALEGFVADGGTMIGTMHTEPWLDRYSSDELLTELYTFASAADSTRFRVFGYLDDADDLTTLCTRVVNQEYATAYVPRAIDSAERTAQTYRVAKLMSRSIEPAGLLELEQEQFDGLVTDIDTVTRTKMRAAADYALLPPKAFSES